MFGSKEQALPVAGIEMVAMADLQDTVEYALIDMKEIASAATEID